MRVLIGAPDGRKHRAPFSESRHPSQRVSQPRRDCGIDIALAARIRDADVMQLVRERVCRPRRAFVRIEIKEDRRVLLQIPDKAVGERLDDGIDACAKNSAGREICQRTPGGARGVKRPPTLQCRSETRESLAESGRHHEQTEGGIGE